MKAYSVGFALASTLTLMLACGDSKPEAQSPSAAPSPSGSASAAVDMAPDAAAPAPAPTTAASSDVTDAGAPASAVTQSPSGVVSVETKDECTPVGVEFEQHARPQIKQCYAEGKKSTKNPDLQGMVTIKILIDQKGKIKKTFIVKKTLPDSVADCMLKAVKNTPFPESDKCWDSSITIPVQFPTPR